MLPAQPLGAKAEGSTFISQGQAGHIPPLTLPTQEPRAGGRQLHGQMWDMRLEPGCVHACASETACLLLPHRKPRKMKWAISALCNMAATVLLGLTEHLGSGQDYRESEPVIEFKLTGLQQLNL